MSNDNIGPGDNGANPRAPSKKSGPVGQPKDENRGTAEAELGTGAELEAVPPDSTQGEIPPDATRLKKDK